MSRLLPPLPNPAHRGPCGTGDYFSSYTAAQMHSYALTAIAAAQVLPSAEPVALSHPGSPEASAMMDSVLAEYEWPANPKNAARAGYEAARRLTAPQPAVVPPDRADDLSESLTRAKRLLVKLYDKFPETRSMIEGHTGSWFVWGVDRGIGAAREQA